MEIPHEFQCPITMDTMVDPVTCEDGYSYERKAITEYLKKNAVSPMTRQAMNPNIILENRTLKTLITDFKFKEEQALKKINSSDNKFDEIDDESFKLINQIMDEDNTPTKSNNTMMLLEIEDIITKINFNKLSRDQNEYFDTTKNNFAIFRDPMLKQDLIKLEKLIKNGNHIHKSFYLFAIINKLPKVIRWLRDNECTIGEDSINFASVIGDKNLIHWLLSNGCVFNIYTFSYAIESGNLDFANWLLSRQCFWGILLDEHYKLIQTNKKIKDWLISKKCPWNL